MDITKIQDEIAKDDVGVDVPVIGRDLQPAYGSDGLQVTFTVLGRDSRAVTSVLEAQHRRANRSGKVPTPDETKANRREVGAAALIAWKGVEDATGKPVPLSPDNVAAVLADRHYLEQVEQGVFAHARFFTPTSAS